MNMRRFLFALAIMLPVAFLFFSWATLMDDLPSYDDFDAILGYLSRPFPERLVSAFAKHNEHRIALTRLAAEMIVALRGSFSFTIMAFVGNLLLLIFAGLWYRVLAPKSRALALGAIWLLLSLANRENQLWAMTSIQNIGVMLFAFGALQLSARASVRSFIAAIACAVLATVASGGGIFVWPCLLLAEWFGARRKGRLATLVCMGMVLFFALAAVPSPAMETIIVQDAPKPGETILAKANILRFQVELTPMFIVRHLGYAGCFFISSLGGVAVFPLVTFAVGCVILLSFVTVWRRRQEFCIDPVFWFLIFVLMNLVPCAVFRAVSFTTNIPSRYLVVCIPVTLATLYLVGTKRVVHIVSFALLALAVVCNVIFYSRMSARRIHLAENFEHWRENPVFLHYPSERIGHAVEVLRRCEQTGVYVRPVGPRSDGESATVTPRAVEW